MSSCENCEKWGMALMQEARTHTAGSAPQMELVRLSTDTVLECPEYQRSHTAKLANSRPSCDEIPDFLRKSPEKREILVKRGVVEEALV